MKALPVFLRSRVARRILALFVVSALLPVTALAFISLFAVDRQLERQSQERVEQLARNGGMSVLQQLHLADNALLSLAADDGAGPVVNRSAAAALPPLRAAWIEGSDGTLDRWPPSDDPPTVPRLSEALLAILFDGDPVVVPGARPTSLLMAKELATIGRPNDLLWVELHGDSIWGPAVTFAQLPTVADFCLLDGDRQPLFCQSGSDGLANAFADAGVREVLGTFSSEWAGDRYLVGHWSFHPLAAFDAAPWTVLVAESEASVYAPLEGFTFTLLAVLATGLAMVALLANVQVRRTLEPLVALEEGTARIAAGDFHSEVKLDSNDEFGALAGSFNLMVRHVGAQFAQLEAGRAIDRAVLGAFDRDEVLRAILSEVRNVTPCRSAAVLLAGVAVPDATPAAEFRWLTGETALGGAIARLTKADVTWLREHRHHGTSYGGGPGFLHAARAGLGPGLLYAFPLMVKGHVRGALILEARDGSSFDEEQVRVARRLANQAAIALEDIRLVEELEEMSWGALRALARAIDAKSPWTAGHSERVTQMALAIGREMGLGEDDLQNLHRGGLLHDVGKIGVPSAVLNADRDLTPDELAQIRSHPEIGARIVEPIGAYASALPMIRQHHEHWDGLGYPAGLSGTDIHPLSRILSVADSYDAMASARPYRSPRSRGYVTDEIVAGSGTQFDPVVVDAFVRLMSAHGTSSAPALGATHNV